jgi:hypothetical protein
MLKACESYLADDLKLPDVIVANSGANAQHHLFTTTHSPSMPRSGGASRDLKTFLGGWEVLPVLLCALIVGLD